MKISIYAERKLLEWSSEMVILAGLFKELPEELPHNYNFRGEARMFGACQLAKDYFKYTENPDRADIFILPYKFKGTNDSYFEFLADLAERNNKFLYAFYNDDDESYYDIPKNVRLYRTSMNERSRQDKEIPMPAFTADFFDNNYIIPEKPEIGYCGHTLHGRAKILNKISNSGVHTNFIVRDGFWAPELPNKSEAKRQFVKNLEENLFTVCYRGAGNFSYRLYETLMMGRIPLLINTSTVLPENIKNQMVYLNVDEDDRELEKKVFEYCHKLVKEDPINSLKAQWTNRKVWLNYSSPKGFINNFYNSCIG